MRLNSTEDVTGLAVHLAARIMSLADAGEILLSRTVRDLVDGKTVTGFSNAEEDYSDSFVGQQVMPFRVEEVLTRRGANYVQGRLFKAFVVRDGRLITGQQQYSGRKVARALIDALGI